MLEPVFAQSASDRHQTYPMTDLCGDDRIKFFNDVLYYYEIGTSGGCGRVQEVIEKNKAMMRRPLARLPEIGDPIQYETGYSFKFVSREIEKFTRIFDEECLQKWYCHIWILCEFIYFLF